jgi:hypothetical protein
MRSSARDGRISVDPEICRRASKVIQQLCSIATPSVAKRDGFLKVRGSAGAAWVQALMVRK